MSRGSLFRVGRAPERSVAPTREATRTATRPSPWPIDDAKSMLDIPLICQARSSLRPRVFVRHLLQYYWSRTRPGQRDPDSVPGARRKSYLEQFLPPSEFAGQYLHNLVINSRIFLARDFHSKAGMKYLIEAFYRSIREDSPVPIPYREILLTSRIMDAIFLQLRASRHAEPASPSGFPPAA